MQANPIAIDAADAIDLAALVIFRGFCKTGRDLGVVAVISALKASRDLRSCKRHHIDAVENGLFSNILFANTLIRMYAKCGSLADARSVFESLDFPDVVSWNALLHGFVENGDSRQALRLLGRMEQEGCLPDGRTFVTALKACSSLAAKEGNAKLVKKIDYLEVAKFFHSEAVSLRQLDIFVANALVDTFAKCGSLEDARLVFERMPGHDVVSWTALVLGHVDNEQCEAALELFELMGLRGCAGNARTFSSALMGCSRLADKEEAKLVDGTLVKAESLEVGMAIHTRASSSGCDSDVFVGNTLLDMYVNCGNMVRARRVFDGMELRDVVSWTTLIQGYAENGEPVVALQLFSHMKLAGCKPDSRCYVAALLACSGLATAEKLSEAGGGPKCLDKTRMIYQEAASSGFGQDIYVNTAAVRAFSKCGSSANARAIFDSVAHRDTFLWNAMLLGHVENGEDDSALGLLMLMREQGHKADARTISAALTACANLGAKTAKQATVSETTKAKYLDQGMALHLEASKSGFDKWDIFVGNALVDMYAKWGSLDKATEVFHRMPHRDVVSWTSMILGYAGNGKEELALELFFSGMDVAANSRTYVVVLVACGNLVALESGKLVEARVYRSGVESDPVVASALVDFRAKCGDMAAGRRVFDFQSSPRDVTLWNAVIGGYSRSGSVEQALSMFQRMRDERLRADAITFFSVLSACSHSGEIDRGRECFQAMAELGISPSVQHYSCLIDLFGRASRLNEALELLETMPLEGDAVARRTILGACQRWRGGGVGKNVFDSLLGREYKCNRAQALVFMANANS